MIRRRSTPKRRSRTLLRTSVIVGVLIIAVVASLPAASYTTGSLGRDASVGVASDPEGVLALTIADTIQKNSNGEWLLDATNNYDEPITVTVTLESGSDSTVYFENSSSAPQNSITIAPGTTESAYVDEGGQPGNSYPLDFTVTGSGPGISVEAERTTTVEGGGGGNGGCSGNSQRPGCR